MQFVIIPRQRWPNNIKLVWKIWIGWVNALQSLSLITPRMKNCLLILWRILLRNSNLRQKLNALTTWDYFVGLTANTGFFMWKWSHFFNIFHTNSWTMTRYLTRKLILFNGKQLTVLGVQLYRLNVSNSWPYPRITFELITSFIKFLILDCGQSSVVALTGNYFNKYLPIIRLFLNYGKKE